MGQTLVVGSEGGIGRHLVPTLRQHGLSVRTFDRVEHRPVDARDPGEADHQVGDVLDFPALQAAMRGVDTVVHLSAIASDVPGQEADIFAVNVQGTWNVLRAAAEVGAGRVVYFSSVNAFGHVGGHGVSRYFPIDDRYPHHPRSTYQLSKHLGEELCRLFSDQHDLVTLCLRPVLVTSPAHYERWNREDPALRREWGSAEYWAYVDVRDVCDATLRCLHLDGTRHDAFLLAADDTFMPEPTAELLDHYYPDVPWPSVDQRHYFADHPRRTLMNCSHAKETLRWHPQHHWQQL